MFPEKRTGERTGVFGEALVHFSLLKKASIKYFSFPSGYKSYCLSGKNNRPEAPDVCPICGSNSCLIGHGWYERIELVAGYTAAFGPFYIYRYLCITTGRTLTMIPNFIQTRKRFLIADVITILEEYFLSATSIYKLCQIYGHYSSTLHRWRNAFDSGHSSKRLCFLPYSKASPGKEFSAQLLTHFQLSGHDDIYAAASMGMMRLHEEFDRRLY